MEKFFGRERKNKPADMMSAAIKSFNKALQEMRNLSSDDPCPDIWKDVIAALSEIISTKNYAERAYYIRARAFYYSGSYESAIRDIDAFFFNGYTYDPTIHGDLTPRTLRAMARIGLQQFLEAEKDLQDEIESSSRFLDERSLKKTRAYYWLLVCKHSGDISAAIKEQFQYY